MLWFSRFVPGSIFCPVFLTCFPSSFEQEHCLNKVTTFSQKSVPTLENFENKYIVNHTWKTFIMTSLHNYSNKILLLFFKQIHLLRECDCILYEVWFNTVQHSEELNFNNFWRAKVKKGIATQFWGMMDGINPYLR